MEDCKCGEACVYLEELLRLQVKLSDAVEKQLDWQAAFMHSLEHVQGNKRICKIGQATS